MMDAGMSWDDVMDVYEEYRTLYEDESLSSSQQASEFAYWLDQHNIKGKSGRRSRTASSITRCLRRRRSATPT